VKDVAQIGATIGREFAYGVIAAVSILPERDLQAALAQLVGAELIFQRGTPPDAMYLFKHALVQEAVYASLVRSRRQQLHGHIARTLEERYPDIVAAEPEILAYHLTEAGLIAPAIDYWRRAGEHSLTRSAYNEAVKQLTRAIEMLRSTPETPEILGEELETWMQMVAGAPRSEGCGLVGGSSQDGSDSTRPDRDLRRGTPARHATLGHTERYRAPCVGLLPQRFP
jgi:predicted ATPase